MAAPAESRAGSSTTEPSREVLAGLIERVTFHSPANGFCVLRIKASRHRDRVTVVGHAAEITLANGSPSPASGYRIGSTACSSRPPSRAPLPAFGEQVFAVIKVRVGPIAQAWPDQTVVCQIMVFLWSHGVGTARTVRICKAYANDDVPVTAENPYRLTRDIRGIGFRTADAIAAR